MTRLERDGKIVAYAQGATFSANEIRQTHDIKRTFCFIDSDDPESYIDPVTVRANTIEDALEVLGVGNSYEAEWGDHRNLVEAYERGSLQCNEREITMTPVELPMYEAIYFDGNN